MTTRTVDPEARARYNANRRRRYAEDGEHREIVLARNRAAYERDPEPQKAAVQARYGSRADKLKDYVAERRARLAAARIEGERVSRIAVFRRDGWICWICLEPTEPDGPRRRRPSIDHVVALIDGGAHTMSNLRCAHLGCNCARYNRLRGRRPAQAVA